MQTQVQTTTRTRVATTVGIILITLGAAAFAAAGAAAVAAPAKLGILASSVTTTPIVMGTQDIPVLGLTVAAQHKDVGVTQLTFHVLADDDGSFATIENDVPVDNHIQHCSLVTTRGMTLAGPSPVDASGALAFSLQAAVPSGKKVEAEVRCSFMTVTPESGTPDIYAWTILATGDVEARTRNNNALLGNQIILETPGGTSLNTQGTIAVTMLETGILSATLDTTTPQEGILLGGSSSIPVATYRFDAVNEPFIIDSLAFTNSGDDAATSVVSISYKNQAGATIRTSSALLNGEVSFRGLDAYVTPGTSSLVSITVDTNSVSAQGARSGDTLHLSLDTDSSFSATGTNSGQQLTTIGSDISANMFVLRKTKPTLFLAPGSPSGSRPPGMGEVLRINVVADPHGDVTLNQLIFKITSTASTPGWNQCGGPTDLGHASNWEFSNVADPSTTLDDDGDWSFLEADGTPCEPGDTLAYAVLNLAGVNTHPTEEIAEGQTITYSLRANTTGASIDDFVQISIPDQTSVTWDSVLSWNDEGEAMNIDGAFIRNLPITGGTIRY